MGFIKDLEERFKERTYNIIGFWASVITIFTFLAAIIIFIVNNALWFFIPPAVFLALCVFFIIQNRKLKKELDKFSCDYKNYAWYSKDAPSVRYANMRVMSIQNILKNVWSDPSNDSDTSENPDFSIKLKEIGEKVGQSVYKDLPILLKNEKDIDKRICKWLEKECNSGWGYFEYHPTGNAPHGRKARPGSIGVTNCFLAHEENDRGKKLCPFLCGYMEKIIKEMYQDSVTVNENGCECGRNTGRELKCWFNIVLKEHVS